MTSIKKLPNFLINQIAAGEVVERPSSVLKELIENSLDAQASHITIELVKSGKSLIKVIDNGKGVHKDDFNLVFERHATSKITTLQELELNQNLGFRGEALASIASVSECEFASNQYSVNEKGELKAKSMQNGTEVTVRNLFFNVPARLKFMKSDQTEYKHCLEVIQNYVLCHHNIHFTLFHNGKKILNYAATQDPLHRIQECLGEDFASRLLSIEVETSDLKIMGFIGKPELAKERNYNQYLFVNQRPIEAPYFVHAVKSAFGSLIFPNEKPPFLIYLTLKPETIDMNVHPRKIEARFYQQSLIYSLILKTVKQTLEKTSLAKTISLAKPEAQSFLPNILPTTNYKPPYSQTNFSYKSFASSTKNPPTNSPQFSNISNTQMPIEQKDLPGIQENVPSLIPIGQIAKSYILAENQDGVVLIDQHAAHEKILYFHLKQLANEQSLKSQPLLTPLVFYLSPAEMQLVESTLETLTSIGFDIEIIGPKSISLNSVPIQYTTHDIDKTFDGLIKDLSDNCDFSSLNKIEDIVINYAACRGAIKFGQSLELAEMKALIEQMDQIAHHQYSCPHGRPTTIIISFKEIEKQFKRI